MQTLLTMYMQSKPTWSATRALNPSYTPGATMILDLSASNSRRRLPGVGLAWASCPFPFVCPFIDGMVAQSLRFRRGTDVLLCGFRSCSMCVFWPAYSGLKSRTLGGWQYFFLILFSQVQTCSESLSGPAFSHLLPRPVAKTRHCLFGNTTVAVFTAIHASAAYFHLTVSRSVCERLL